MKSPDCLSEMERGFIQSGRCILWTKEKQRLTMKPESREAFILAENMLGGAVVSAFHCKSCRKIVIEY